MFTDTIPKLAQIGCPSNVRVLVRHKLHRMSMAKLSHRRFGQCFANLQDGFESKRGLYYTKTMAARDSESHI